MTLIDARKAEFRTPLIDLEDQTTPITGAELPTRVTVVDAVRGHVDFAVTLASGPSVDVWAAVKYEPLNLEAMPAATATPRR